MTDALAARTTFGIGGSAAHFVEAASSADLVGAVRSADSRGEPVFVLSGGSNVLIGDALFPGTVIHVANLGRRQEASAGSITLTVSAGETMDQIVALAIDQKWAGLEALSGIPGLVGAAPVQNIGAYGSEIGPLVHSLTVWDRHLNQTRTLSGPACCFSYRDSVMKQSREPGQATGRYVVLEVRLRLTPSAMSGPIAYTELARTLDVPLGGRVPLADVRAAVLQLRRSKGMIVDATDKDSCSAGSFFTNPVLSPEVAAGLPPEAPRYAQPDGSVKTSAAWLIDHAGFPKGFGTGPAKLSTKHTLAITNRGGATAEDVVALARQIRAGVNAKFGITLEPEPVLVGVTL